MYKKYFIAIAILYVAFWFFPGFVEAATLTVGPREDLLTDTAIAAKGLGYWPDAGFGIQKNSNGTYTFYASSGGGLCSPDGLPARTVGTLADPTANSVTPCVPIGGMKHTYNYNGGGSLYKDPTTGTLLTTYHAEKWPQGNYLYYWSLLGMAKSVDGGNTWTDLGEIISPTTPYDPNSARSLDMGFGPMVTVGQYFYVYFSDIDPALGYRRLGVARALISDVLNTAINQSNVVSWSKYYNGAWSQPGLGGSATYLGSSSTDGIGSFHVAYNSYLNKYILVGGEYSTTTHNDLFYMESSDGIAWASRQLIESDPGNARYPAFIGLGADPLETGSQFYIYYQYIPAGTGSKPYTLARRSISFTGAVSPTPSPTPTPTPTGNTALRFFGNGVNAPDLDRVKIRIDDPANTNPGPPADVGATDFTLEFWMKAAAADNPAPAVSCGSNNNWIYGNIIVDRDRYNQDRSYGISIAGGRAVFGVDGDGTGKQSICGTTNILDDRWHHVAVERRRSDGWMWLFVDGALQSQVDGPDGDISYPDNGVPGNFCNGPCTNSDPYLVIGAEKHDAGSQFPSYNGLFDEMRISRFLRYASNFTRPQSVFIADANTVGLYHFNEGIGDTITDVSGAAGGPSHGVRRFGGNPAGPQWVTSDAPLGGGAPTPTPTPTPPPTGGCINPSPIPSGFSTPCPVFGVAPTSGSVSQNFTVSLNPPTGGTVWIYKTLYITEGGTWKSITLPGTVQYTYWLQGNVTYNLLPTTLGLTAGTHYLASWDWTWDVANQCYKGPGATACGGGEYRIQQITLQ